MEVRLKSTNFVNVPGYLEWAKVVYRNGTRKERTAVLKVFTETLRDEELAKRLLAGALETPVEGTDVVFEVEENPIQVAYR